MILYFQIRFIKVSCTLHVKNKIWNSIKIRRKNSAMKRKYHDNPEPQKEYKKRKYKENNELKKEKKQEKKKVFDKVEQFHLQIRQGPCYILETVVRRCSSK